MSIKSPLKYALQLTLKVQISVVLVFVSVMLVMGKVFFPAMFVSLALSFLLGAGIFVVSNAYFTFYALRYFPHYPHDARMVHSYSAHRYLSSLNKGQKGKFIVAAVLFALAFNFNVALQVSANVMALFVGYILLIVSQWLVARKVAEKIQKQRVV